MFACPECGHTQAEGGDCPVDGALLEWVFVCPECGRTQLAAGYCPVDGALLGLRGEDPLLGIIVGGYRVARPLDGFPGRYRGIHPITRRRVLIEVLSFVGGREDFFSEARAVHQLRHENLVEVLAFGQLPDRRFFVITEDLEGAPLSDLVRQLRPMPLGSLAQLATEVLDGLGAAHDADIIHRHLTPDNVFVTTGGRGKIRDLFIATLRPENSAGCGPGRITGWHYMMPEKLMSYPLDARADIYAFGVILFEAATRQRPFHNDSILELLRQITHEPPPSPRALRRDMPPAYEQVILRALAKNREQRFDSAAELADALRAATRGLPAEEWAPITPRRPEGR